MQLKKRQYRKIASHVAWYRGAWEKDICQCGSLMLVPAGKKGFYCCNTCADAKEVK